MAELTKYGVARHFYLVIVKRAVVDFAVSADWTPVAGDVKISIDGGAAANVTNLPTAIAMGNTAYWDFSLTSGELTGKQMVVTVADSATKAVEDQSLRIETFGHASAQHPFDLDTATVNPGVGGIGSTAFAANAIDSGALADSAVTEIQTGLVTRRNTAQAGAASTITLDASASAVDSFYLGQQVVLTSGTGAGQVRLITGYVGSTKVATVGSAWATNPDNTSVFALVPNRSLVSAMATDTLDANALKTDAVTEIQSGLATSAALATVQADTDDIQTRIPAALVSGRIDASVGAMAANTVTASAIATDAIGAAELAADAVTEIQSGLATAAAQATLQADTDDIQTRLPVALVSGRMDSSVGAMAANTMTAAAAAADLTTELQTGLATAVSVAAVQADTDDIQTRLPTALVSGRIDASVGAMAADVLTAAAVATDALGALELAGGAATEIATAVWAQAMSELSGVPTPSDSVLAGIEWLVALSRNLRTQSATTETVFKDDGTTALATSLKSDVGGTFSRGEYT